MAADAENYDIIFDITSKGRDPLKKNVFFRALPELPNPPPPDPNLGNLVLFFPDVKIQDLKVTWGEGEGDILKPKKQLKVQYIGIFEEIDSF